VSVASVLVRDEAPLVLSLDLRHALLVLGEDRLLVRRDDDVVLRDRHAGLRRVLEAEGLDHVEHARDRMRAVLVDELGDERVELALRQRPVDVVVQRILRVVILDGLGERTLDLGVEDHAARGGQKQVAVPAELDRLLERHLLRVDRVLDLFLAREALGPRLDVLQLGLVEVGAAVREVVRAEHHVLRRRGQGTAARG